MEIFDTILNAFNSFSDKLVNFIKVLYSLFLTIDVPIISLLLLLFLVVIVVSVIKGVL